MEVLHVDILVWSRLTLAPQKKTLLGGHFLHGDILDGETKDDRPNHTKGHLQVTVNDFYKE